jgi:dipeptidyl-peptidase-3
MKGTRRVLGVLFLLTLSTACVHVNAQANPEPPFETVSEQFADIRVLRYHIPEFEKLSLQQKQLAYFLSMAALAGRDIAWDQHYKHNLTIRRTLEEIIKHYKGNRDTTEFKNFLVYAKRVWFSNGIHHHYSNDKFLPEITPAYFANLVSESTNAHFPVQQGETPTALAQRLTPILFDPTIAKKKVCQDSSQDLVKCSAVNFYDGVTQAEVEAYFKGVIDPNNQEPVSHGLNSKKIKVDGQVKEHVYSSNGLYGEAIKQIVSWLKLAAQVAETDIQRQSLEKLVEFYETGNLQAFDEYSILWVQDTTPVVDAINGFIEVYNDPLGMTGSWESVVSIKDLDATQKFGVLSHEAGWFERNSPIMEQHKRENVTGVSYKVINVVQESGDSSPATPIGINLPNANWIRAKHGSKSVSLTNIEHAYELASKESGPQQAFYLPEQQAWLDQHSSIADRLHTGLHEVIGHGSGKLEPGVASVGEVLKNYASPLEEARADLVGLYYIGDQHLVDIGVSPTTDIVKAAYTRYINGGLIVQLSRVELGKDLEEAHMRNRQLISKWVYEKGQVDNVIERQDVATPDGTNTYFVVRDFDKLRTLFGQLLREVQRIKSQGDYEAGKNLVEGYGVKIDQELHAQVKRRWAKLNLAPYAGFINPSLKPVKDASGQVIDVLVEYPSSFTEQMLHYAEHHSFLH